MRRRWQHRQCARSLSAPSIMHNTFPSSSEACDLQPVMEHGSSQPAPTGSQPVRHGLPKSAGRRRRRKDAPTSRQMLCLTGGRSQGEDFPPLPVGSGHTRWVAQEGMGVFPFSPYPGRAGRSKGKEKWVAGKIKPKEARGLAAPGPGHQKSDPIPWDCAVGGTSPSSAGHGASLLTRAGALAEHKVTASLSRPSHALL